MSSQQALVPPTSPISRDTYGNISPPPAMYDTSTSTTESWSTAKTGPLHHHHSELQQQPNSRLHPLKPLHYNSTTAMTPHLASPVPAASTARSNNRGSFKSQAALLMSSANSGPLVSPRHPGATPRHNNTVPSPQQHRRPSSGDKKYALNTSNNSSNHSMNDNNNNNATTASRYSSARAAIHTTQSEPGGTQISPYAAPSTSHRYSDSPERRRFSAHVHRFANLDQRQQRQQQQPQHGTDHLNQSVEQPRGQQKPIPQQTPPSPSASNTASAARTAFLTRRQQQRKQDRQQMQQQQPSDPIPTTPSSNSMAATPKAYNSIRRSLSNRSPNPSLTNENAEPGNSERNNSNTSRFYPDPEPVVIASDEEEQQQHEQNQRHNPQPPLKPFYALRNAELQEPREVPAAKRFSAPTSARRKSETTRPPQTQYSREQLSSSESRYAKAATAALSRGSSQPDISTPDISRYTASSTATAGTSTNQWHRDGPRRSYSDRLEELRKQVAYGGPVLEDDIVGATAANNVEPNVEEYASSARQSRAEREELSSRRDRTSTSLPPVRRRRPLQQPQEGAPQSASKSAEILQDLERNDAVNFISTGSPQRISEIKERLWDRDERLQSSMHPRGSLSPQHRRHSTSNVTPSSGAPSGFKSKFYQAAAAAHRETAVVGGDATSLRVPSTPPRPSQTKDDEGSYNDAFHSQPRNGTPPRPRPERPQSPVLPGSLSRRSTTPPRSVANSNSSAFHEHRSATPPRPITVNTVMPPTPPQPRSRSTSPRRAREFLEEEQHHVPLPSDPHSGNSSNNNGDNLLTNRMDSTSQQLMGKRSVASLVAKLNAVSRDDPQAALAQIDHILRAESTDDVRLQHEHHFAPQTSPALPQQHAAGVVQEHHHSHPHHAHSHKQHEEGGSDDDEGSSDEETSVSELTDPTYMSSKPTHEQLHDVPPPLGLSTATYRRPRPSALQSYNIPASAANQAVAGLELVQRHHQRKSSKKNRVIAAHVHAQANAQAQANTPLQSLTHTPANQPQQSQQSRQSDFVNISNTNSHHQDTAINPTSQNGQGSSPGQADQGMRNEPPGSDVSAQRKAIAMLQRQQQELLEQQDRLKMEKLQTEQQQRAEQASYADHARQQQQDEEVDAWHRQLTETMQKKQEPDQHSRASGNDDRSAAKELNRSSSFVSGGAGTHVSTTSNNRDKSIASRAASREQQSSAASATQKYEAMNTNTPEKAIQPSQGGKSYNPFDDSLDVGYGCHDDAEKHPKERKLDRFISRKQKKHDEVQLQILAQLDEQEQALMNGEDLARKIKAWDELSSPVSVSKTTDTKASGEIEDDKGTASGASAGASSGQGPASETAPANTSMTQSVQSRSSRRSHPWETGTGREVPSSSRFKVDTRDTSMDNALGIEAEFFMQSQASPARELRKERLARAAMERVREGKPQNNWDETSNTNVSRGDSKTAISRESGERTAHESLSYAVLDTSRDSTSQVVPRVMPVVPLAQQQEFLHPPEAFQVDPKLLGKGFEVTPLFGAATRQSKPAPAPTPYRWVDMPSNTFFARKHENASSRDVAVRAEPKLVATLVDEDGTQPVTMVRSQHGGMPPARPLVRVPSVPANVSYAFADIPFEDTDLTENSKKPLLVSPSIQQNNSNAGFSTPSIKRNNSNAAFSSSQVDGSVIHSESRAVIHSESRGRRGISSFLKKRARGRKKGSPSPSPRKDTGSHAQSTPNSAAKPRGRRLTSKSPSTKDCARSTDRRGNPNDHRSRSQSAEDGGRIRNPKIAKKFSRLLKVYGNELNDDDRGHF